MIKAGIIGGAGYTGGELIRILLHHNKCNIEFIQSSSNTGNPITDVHSDLIGDTNLRFTGTPDLKTIDVLFLCMGHGKSEEYIKKTVIPQELKVIDLSNDFRVTDKSHSFIYGLPELNREKIKLARNIANPGCFATGIQLALLPLAANKLISGEIHINAITGSTGAGQSLSETTHFSWRNNNLSAYKIFEHQHNKEIIQSLKQLQNTFNFDLNFIPVRGNHTRGIFTSVYTEFSGSIKEAQQIYKKYYQEHPFVFISENNTGLKQVVNTNKAIIYLEKHNNKLVIISLIDNLLKGASGQAVQNMNLMFGLNEKTGLDLKPTAF